MQNYKNLQIWRDAYSLTLQIYALTRGFPSDEIYGLVQQVRRSAHSVNSNIAEGAGRNTTPDFLRFLYQSMGSLAETKNHLELAKDLNYISDEQFLDLEKRANILGKMLNTFISKLKTNH